MYSNDDIHAVYSNDDIIANIFNSLRRQGREGSFLDALRAYRMATNKSLRESKLAVEHYIIDHAMRDPDTRYELVRLARQQLFATTTETTPTPTDEE